MLLSLPCQLLALVFSKQKDRKSLRLTCQYLRSIVNSLVDTVKLPLPNERTEIARLSQARMEGSMVCTDQEIAQKLVAWPQLQTLYLPSSLFIVQSAMNVCNNITHLSFLDSKAVHSVLPILTNHRKIEKLNLGEHPILQADLHSLSSLTSLQSLQLSVTPGEGQPIITALSLLTALRALILTVKSSAATQVNMQQFWSGLVHLLPLQRLQLTLGHLETSAAPLGQLTNLTSLDLEVREEQMHAPLTIPDFLGQLIHLEKLRWFVPAMYTAAKLPDSMCNLRKLREMCVCLLQNSETVTQLTSLRDLSLVHLINPPQNIGSMQGLTRLNVSCSRAFTMLPDSLSRLCRLQELDITHCMRLGMLPSVISSLSSLTALRASGIDMRELPDWIAGMRCLRILDMDGNYFTTLPDSLSRLTQLEQLSLFGCPSLTCCPEVIGRLPCLTWLNLSHNSFTSLPDSLGELSSLRLLFLFGCTRLVALPQTFTRLHQLHTVSISSCTAGDTPRVLPIPETAEVHVAP
jgi:hypothetical protein